MTKLQGLANQQQTMKRLKKDFWKIQSFESTIKLDMFSAEIIKIKFFTITVFLQSCIASQTHNNHIFVVEL